MLLAAIQGCLNVKYFVINFPHEAERVVKHEDQLETLLGSTTAPTGG